MAILPYNFGFNDKQASPRDSVVNYTKLEKIVVLPDEKFWK